MVFKNWDYPVIFRIDGNRIIINSLNQGAEGEKCFFHCQEYVTLTLVHSGGGYRIRTSIMTR